MTKPYKYEIYNRALSPLIPPSLPPFPLTDDRGQVSAALEQRVVGGPYTVGVRPRLVLRGGEGEETRGWDLPPPAGIKQGGGRSRVGDMHRGKRVGGQNQ